MITLLAKVRVRKATERCNSLPHDRAKSLAFPATQRRVKER